MALTRCLGSESRTKFDLDVILALVQFADRLRQNFIAQFEKTRDAKTSLPVFQPLTSRELRRCAYELSEMPAAERVAGQEEATARALIERFFLTHIYKQDDREKIRTAMTTWSSQKRLAA